MCLDFEANYMFTKLTEIHSSIIFSINTLLNADYNYQEFIIFFRLIKLVFFSKINIVNAAF